MVLNLIYKEVNKPSNFSHFAEISKNQSAARHNFVLRAE
jgi:hypothetical protein